MHLAFALPPLAETGGGGGAAYVDGLVSGLHAIGAHVDLLVGVDPAFPAGSTPVVDGMLLPRLSHRLDELVRLDAVALIHHVAAAAHRSEASKSRTLEVQRSILSRIRRIVATSEPVSIRLGDEFGVRAYAVPPGLGDAALATPDPHHPIILSLGVLTRRKGHDRLIHMASRLLDIPWHLIIAGDNQREPAYAAELRALAEDLGLGSRVTILADPTPAQLETEWSRATVLALATRWEGYPSTIAQALQRGIPCLTTSAANAAAILPATAGAICSLDDEATFGKCLRRLLFDADLRSDMASAARTASQQLPRWSDRARDFIRFLEQ